MFYSSAVLTVTGVFREHLVWKLLLVFTLKVHTKKQKGRELAL